MPASNDCLEIERWDALLDVALPPDQRGRLECHLESCPLCQNRIYQDEKSSDEWRKMGRQLGDPTIVPADPTLVYVMARLHDVVGPDRVALVPSADLYFLHPSDRPDILGTFGDYEVKEVIGQGGMGIVLKAYEPALHRHVAIKVMAVAVAGSATARRRFTREAQAAAAVCHENIVPVYCVSEADGLPYLVMQYVAGKSLQDRLDRTGPLELIETVRIGLQTASGLAAAHAQGLIHRDIKPANLLLESGLARVKITDFGLARMVDDVALTQNGVVAGTPEYMAPEQARAEPVDHRADLFSLGSVLYALCTGVSPFRGATAVAVVHKVSEQQPTPLRLLNPDIPCWLETLIGRLLAKAPADRIQSAAEVAALLEGYLSHLRQPRTVPAPALPPPADGYPGRSETKSRTEGVRRFLQRFWLPALAFLAGLGPALFLLAQVILPPAQAPPPNEPLFTDVYQDFRGGKPLLPSWKLYGPDVDAVTRLENEGLRITLPATRPNHYAVGVAPKLTLSGDFEITGSYEVLSADQPTEGYGVGVSLNFATDGRLRKFGKIARFWRADNGSAHVAETWNKDLPKPDDWQLAWEPTEVRVGQLRLVRKGSMVRYLVAEGSAKDFRKIVQWPFNTDDVAYVRFEVCDSGSPGNRIDARLLDLRIRTGPPIPEEASENAPPLEQKRPDGPKVWLVAATLLGLLLSGALGVCLYLRYHAARTPTDAALAGQQVKSELAAPSISLACAGCGKNLKIRAELAGKKVKCPGCGAGVLVPG